VFIPVTSKLEFNSCNGDIYNFLRMYNQANVHSEHVSAELDRIYKLYKEGKDDETLAIELTNLFNSYVGELKLKGDTMVIGFNV